jgi:hypothetical protein
MNLYHSLLKQGKAAIEALQIPFKVREEEKKLELKILTLEQQLATDEVKVEEYKAAYPVQWDKLLDAIDNMELTKRRLKLLGELQNEMFNKQITE